ncbi:cytotoxic and regulatory T-cell molecule [Antennarius striatus]|uniref:cytotoxic and regulatory T-cell molecule n=1 Tax=Antennarius striatus TaxID=241820 RepID=UPI0035B437C3
MGSVALWERVTVIKGQTVKLSCPMINAHQMKAEWKNPEGHIMFFKQNMTVVVKVLNNKRYSISELSKSKFTISISEVTLEDGGNYTCSVFGSQVAERTVELSVIDHPKIRRTKHDGTFHIKCTAEGNDYPPQIFWKLDHGPEILAHSQVLHRGKSYVSTAVISIQSLKKRVTVKCLVHHPALHTRLMDFVKIGHILTEFHPTTTTSSPMFQSQRSTQALSTTVSWSRHGPTTGHHGSVNGSSSESSIIGSAFPPNGLKTDGDATMEPRNPVPSIGSTLSTSYDSRIIVSSVSTRKLNDAINNGTKATGWTFIFESTEIPSSNHTQGNRTVGFNESETQVGTEGRPSLLVFLVVLLIFSLLVVVIFIAIKLRKAHITWKREDEESNPSEESSRSKSCQEGSNSAGPRRRGLCSMPFTQYGTEEPPPLTSVIYVGAKAATSAPRGVNDKQTSPPPPETAL